MQLKAYLDWMAMLEYCRDNLGTWKINFAANVGQVTAIEIEFWGLYYGLNVLWLQGVKKLIVDLDSKVAITLVHNDMKRNHPFYPLIMSCRNLISRYWIIKLQYTFQEGNQTTDQLAHQAVLIEGGFQTRLQPLKDVLFVLWEDCMGVSFLRLVQLQLVIGHLFSPLI